MEEKKIHPAIAEFAIEDRAELLAKIAEQAREIEFLERKVDYFSDNLDAAYEDRQQLRTELAALNQPISDEREAFERECARYGLTLRPDGCVSGSYLKEIQCAWMLWQARARQGNAVVMPDDFRCEYKELERLLNATALMIETPCQDSATLWAACLADVEARLNPSRGVPERLETKGSRKALGAMNAKLRAKVGRLERELASRKSFRYMPEDWVVVQMVFDDPEYPEDFAYGPPTMMNRLRMILEKYYAMRFAPSQPDQCAGVVVPRELLERLISSNSPYLFDAKTYWAAHKEASALLAGSGV